MTMLNTTPMNIFKTFIVSLLLLASTSLSAQCTFKNTAFKSGEFLTYNLYFNWKFVWVKAGYASMSVVQSRFNGEDAYRCSLTTRGNGRLDNYFLMRDTLLCYASTDMAPLYFRKGAREGERYTVDEVWYSYADGTSQAKMRRLNNDGKVTHRTEVSQKCITDMLNLFLRARSFSPKGWKKGYVLSLQVADGNGTEKGQLTYEGIETIKADNGKKYRCLALTYAEWSKRKQKYVKISTFYVTDDSNHIPIRIDLFLNFGAAKAFLVNMKGMKNPVTAEVK